jgi:eukaryotic-like serine/threonine-protein kinase
MNEVPDPRVGTVLQGRYKILERKTAGSMGVVYRGERLTLKRAVAIKFLNEGYAATEDGRRRFEVEARAMSRLEHPNCVPVTDFGVDDHSPYLVMDYVSGRTLRDLLVAEWRVAPARAVGLVRQILSGLAHAHTQGIIHRDIKPENILVTTVEGHGEHVRIVDFGLAKLRDEGSMTTGVAIGTPGYMSPEQTIGEKADERADVYACGIILYELLAGAKPFQGQTPFDIMRQHRDTPPPPLETTAAGVAISSHLEAVVMKALAKSREDRYQSASEFRAALEAVDEAHGRRSARGGKWALLGLGALAMAGGAFFAWTQWVREDGAAAPSPRGEVAEKRVPEEKAEKPKPKREPKVAKVEPAPDAAPAPPKKKVEPAEIRKLRAAAASSGDYTEALAALEEMRAADPSSTDVHYALANLYAESQRWPDAIASYAAILRLDAAYKTDARLIGDVVEALGSDDAYQVAARLIENELGAAALPRLEEASRSTNPELRTRAGLVLSGLKQRL